MDFVGFHVGLQAQRNWKLDTAGNPVYWLSYSWKQHETNACPSHYVPLSSFHNLLDLGHTLATKFSYKCQSECFARLPWLGLSIVTLLHLCEAFTLVSIWDLPAYHLKTSQPRRWLAGWLWCLQALEPAFFTSSHDDCVLCSQVLQQLPKR